MKRLQLFLIPLFLISTLTNSANAQERLFAYVENSTPMNTILVADSSGWTKVVEIDTSNNSPVTGDTLNVWVQHYGPGGEMDPQYRKADLVVACYASFIEDTSNHIFPDVFGKIGILSTDKRVLVFDEKNRTSVLTKHKNMIQDFLDDSMKDVKIKTAF